MKKIISLIGLSFFIYLLVVERSEIDSNFSFYHVSIMLGIFLAAVFFIIQVFEDAKRNTTSRA